MFLAILFTFPIIACIWWAVALKLTRGFPRLRVAISAFAIANLLYLVLVLAVRRYGLTMWVPTFVHVWGYSWYLFTVPLVLLPISLLGIVLLVRKKTAEPVLSAELKEELSGAALIANHKVTRRQLLQASVAAAPLVINAGVTAKALFDFENFRIRDIDVPIASLPTALDGFVIAHVTDIHVGRFTKGKVLERIVEVTNGMNADLAVMTGDLIDAQLLDLPAGLEVLKAIRAKNGLYTIEGNHDLFEDRKRFESTMRKADVNFLLNESTVAKLNGVNVVLHGLRWGGGGPGRFGAGFGKNLEELLAKPPTGDFSILLSHHPDIFESATKAGIPLTLAGHTHGGQLMLTDQIGGGPAFFKHWSGLYERPGGALVVSNGVGNWMPLRINAPAEIVKITLRRAPAAVV